MIIEGTSLTLPAVIMKDGAPCDLTGATSVVIRRRKPDLTEADLTATVDDAETGAVHVDLLPAAVDQRGSWLVWAEAVLAGGEIVRTAAKEFIVWARGSVG